MMTRPKTFHLQTWANTIFVSRTGEVRARLGLSVNDSKTDTGAFRTMATNVRHPVSWFTLASAASYARASPGGGGERDPRKNIS